ncbi:hypothetical protein HZA97_09250 [Candidatus Woesearchaeota archaeon]|nr:hypothetical protein [Candidatus Woesearchaeota archaeon]
MSIEDSLKKINLEEKKKKQKINIKTKVGLTDENLIDALKKYICSTAEQIRKNTSFRPRETLITILAPYLRFNEQMQAKFTEIPREELVAILQEQNEDLNYLLTQTDAREALPEILEIKRTSFNSFLNTPEVKSFLKINEIRQFIKGAETVFTIPDIGFIGLFIEEGEKALAYARIAKNYRHTPLISFNEKYNTQVIENSNDQTLIELNGLQKYHEQTREKDVSKMIQQANEFKKMTDSWENKDISKARETLFKLLQQYHPELVYVNEDAENKTNTEQTIEVEE